MRTFRIDYTNIEKPLTDGDEAGFYGEHNATQLVISPPLEMANCQEISSYRVAFELTNCRVAHSEPIEKTETVTLKLTSQITSSSVISIQLEGYSADGNLVAKSKKITKIKFKPSVKGVETFNDPNPSGVINEINANTKARHTHENADVLNSLKETNGSLTYKDKPIGGSSKPVIKSIFFLNDWSDAIIIAGMISDDEIDFIIGAKQYDNDGNLLDVGIAKIPENAYIVDISLKYDGKLYNIKTLKSMIDEKGELLISTNAIFNISDKPAPFNEAMCGHYIAGISNARTNSDFWNMVIANSLAEGFYIYFIEVEREAEIND